MSGRHEDSLYQIGEGDGFRGAEGLEVLHAPAEGAQYRGVVIIEWPPPGASPYSAMTGWNVAITDAVTGQAITTVMNADITVHADAGRMVTATLTMFAGEAGDPLPGGMPVMKDGEALTGVFPFLVSEMRVRDR